MEKEKLEMLLEDIMDDLKNVNNLLQEQKQQSMQLEEKISSSDVKLNQLNLEKVPLNKEAVENIIGNAILEIKRSIDQKPKPVIRQWRFALFPEQYSKEYYRVIFRLIMWQTLVLAMVVLFMLGKQALENNREFKLKHMENDQYKKAWMYLYDKERRGKRRWRKYGEIYTANEIKVWPL